VKIKRDRERARGAGRLGERGTAQVVGPHFPPRVALLVSECLEPGPPGAHELTREPQHRPERLGVERVRQGEPEPGGVRLLLLRPPGRHAGPGDLLGHRLRQFLAPVPGQLALQRLQRRVRTGDHPGQRLGPAVGRVPVQRGTAGRPRVPGPLDNLGRGLGPVAQALHQSGRGRSATGHRSGRALTVRRVRHQPHAAADRLGPRVNVGLHDQLVQGHHLGGQLVTLGALRLGQPVVLPELRGPGNAL
jgi:hypothetical protein